MSPAPVGDIRAALAFFTRLRVGPSGPGAVPGRILPWAPAAGAVVAAAAGAAAAAVLLAEPPGAGLIAAVAAVGTAAHLTRGLHLDGLADVADGLGSAKDPAGAVSVMQRSDIGPFGVVALVVVLLLQVGALAGAAELGGWRAVAAVLLTGLAAGRVAPAVLCRRGTTAAAGSRLGAWAAGTVPVPAVFATALLTAAAGAAVLLLLGGPASGWGGPGAVAAACLAALLLGRTARHRFAGITGDVIGAAVEAGQTAAMLVALVALS